MKRIAQILGVLGGIGALVWAMRDRLVSVALPREPQLPTYRVPDRTPADREVADEPKSDPEGSDDEVAPTITDVSGIGPVYATRLAAAGVNSVDDLAQADATRLAEAAEVPEGRAEKWVESAREMTGED